MSKRTLGTIAALVGGTVVAGTAMAQPAPGTIIGLDAGLHGDWTLGTTPYWVPGSQGGKYDLDTLVVEEHVPGFVSDENPTLIPDGPGTRPAKPWSDLWIHVVRESSDDPAMIAFDKKVFNWTPARWTDFHMEIGVIPFATQNDVGGPPPPLIWWDGLEFKTDPEPTEELGKFGPVMFGMGEHPEASIWWFDGANGGIDREIIEYPGVVQQDCAQFWAGLTIPDDLFYPVLGHDPTRSENHEEAYFTIRQHWTPAPGAMGLFAMAGGVLGVRRRRA